MPETLLNTMYIEIKTVVPNVTKIEANKLKEDLFYLLVNSKLLNDCKTEIYGNTFTIYIPESL